MAPSPIAILPERIKMARACAITGLSVRRMQQKAERGEIDGVIKIDGVWTFDVAKLRAWLSELEEQQCRTRKAIGAARPQRTRSGEATRSMAASASGISSGGGRYEQAMSRLLGSGLRKTSRG